MSMANDSILELVSRALAGEASAEELQQLEQLLAQDESARARYGLLQPFLNQHETVSPTAVEESLQGVLGRLQLTPLTSDAPQAKVVSWRRVWQRSLVAAVTIGLLGCVGYWWFASKKINNDPATLVEKHNAVATKSTIVLPDGSKVWLNADSRIKYPESFTGRTREVYLNGEAFFEVTKNPRQPFIIHLAKGTVRVLGTSFNIRAYDNERVIETSVATGRVAFIPDKPANKKQPDTVFLTPNNKAQYSLNNEEVKVAPTAATDDKAWTEGKLIFKARTLEEIAVELERNFGKKVVFMDEEVKTYRLTGAFENNSLEEILYYLSKSKNFSYTITNTGLLIATK